MTAVSHQIMRYRFQAFWLVIFAAIALAGAPLQAWAGLLGAGLFSALFLKRAACSFACPVFPLGELLWRGGEKLFGRTFAAPFWLDLVLRSGKYLVLGWLILALAGGHLEAGLQAWHAVPLLFATILLSLFFQMPWCRYLCPYGALVGLVSMASVFKIRRSPRHCVRCHKCSNRCPANLPVMLRTIVRSPECFACYRCVDGCPAPGALALAAPGNRVVPAWVVGFLVSAMLILGLIAGMTLPE